MTRLEDDLQSALRATAEQIPPGPPPPLTLPERRRLTRTHPRGWRAWIIPLAAVFLVGVVVAGSLALASVLTRRPGPVSPPFPPQPDTVLGVPAYYVALTSPSGALPAVVPTTTTATIRATTTGKVLATVAVPQPYHAFTAVAAAADDRTFVLVAVAGKPGTAPPDIIKNTTPAARFFMLHLDPASPTAAGQVRLQALPASYIPTGNMVEGMALSADGAELAATIGDPVRSKLYVYHLATGQRHVWSWAACRQCTSTGVGAGYGGPYPGALSWAADGRTLAFVFDAGDGFQMGVRLLDTRSPSTDLLADSKLTVAQPNFSLAAEAVITPDGRTILTVRHLLNAQGRPLPVQQLVTVSVATGNLVAVLNQVPFSGGTDYEQIQWTNRSGSDLLISGAQRGRAEVLTGGRARTIPWSPQIFDAAW